MIATPTKTKAPTKVPNAPIKAKAHAKIAYATQLPRIKTRGFVQEFLKNISKEEYQSLYDSVLIGRIMESVYTITDQYSLYKEVQSNIVSVDYIGDFTFDLMFRMMNIRKDVDERMAMEIAGFVQLYLPQRTFTKTTITVDSVDADGNEVTKVLDVKLYYAYEADAVQWLIKSFFNKNDLIDERYRQMNATVTPYSVLNESKDENPVIQTFFFGDDDTANDHNHLTFQSEMMTLHFPVTCNIFRPIDMIINGFQVYGCASIYTMYMNRFSSAFCS